MKKIEFYIYFGVCLMSFLLFGIGCGLSLEKALGGVIVFRFLFFFLGVCLIFINLLILGKKYRILLKSLK